MIDIDFGPNLGDPFPYVRLDHWLNFEWNTDGKNGVYFHSVVSDNL